MAKYPVLRRLLVDGETHEPGAVVELDDEIVDDLPQGVLGKALPDGINPTPLPAGILDGTVAEALSSGIIGETAAETDSKKKGGEKPSA